jgi:hypothetical protein
VCIETDQQSFVALLKVPFIGTAAPLLLRAVDDGGAAVARNNIR